MDCPPTKIRLRGEVQTGKNDASRWLARYNESYRQKIGMSIFPGSLNLVLAENFDWSSDAYASRLIALARGEYGGERDVLLLPCTLPGLGGRRAFLWTTTLGAQNRDDQRLVEVITDVKLREAFGLKDGDAVVVEIEIAQIAGDR